MTHALDAAPPVPVVTRFWTGAVLARGIPHTCIRVARMSDAGVDLYEDEHRAL